VSLATSQATSGLPWSGGGTNTTALSRSARLCASRSCHGHVSTIAGWRSAASSTISLGAAADRTAAPGRRRRSHTTKPLPPCSASQRSPQGARKAPRSQAPTSPGAVPPNAKDQAATRARPDARSHGTQSTRCSNDLGVTFAAARPRSSSAPSSLGCSGGRSSVPAEDEDYVSEESHVEQHRHRDGGDRHRDPNAPNTMGRVQRQSLARGRALSPTSSKPRERPRRMAAAAEDARAPPPRRPASSRLATRRRWAREIATPRLGQRREDRRSLHGRPPVEGDFRENPRWNRTTRDSRCHHAEPGCGETGRVANSLTRTPHAVAGASARRSRKGRGR
jgi:hypothetical protein